VRRTANNLATLSAGGVGAVGALVAAGASPAVAAPALLGIGAFAFVMQSRDD
jgi:hypothetical protein